MNVISVSRKLGDKDLIIETGKMAKQADGAVVVRYGGNVMLVTACMADEPAEGTDFFPLTVDYNEKYYAAGKIPGGYLKREGKPTDQATLFARLIDRPIRPLFPKGFFNPVQVVPTTLSADQEYSMGELGIVGASAALSISRIPFLGPIGGVRIIYINGEFKVNPTLVDIENAGLDIIVAGTKEGITMVEGGAKEVSEDILLQALEIGHGHIMDQIAMIEELVAKINPEKYVMETESEKKLDEATAAKIREFAHPLIKKANFDADKKRRSSNIKEIMKKALEQFEITKENESYAEAKTLLEEIEVEVVRNQIIEEGVRADGRKSTDIRDITIEIDLFENLHGTALFTRGQTQSLGIVTLGTSRDVKYLDWIESKETETTNFMLHYNFPPFSVGEVKRMGSPGRREIGHGNLARRAIEGVLPKDEDFPYTIRIVSEVLESNGSSSMATVCSSSLSLMAAGVPIRAAVAGIAMGLIWNKEQGKYVVLSDIQGLEDHHGDMDFKVAGTTEGITAFQMDVKTIGITKEIMKEALEQAREGRMFVLEKMSQVISEPRKEVAPCAPKVIMLMVPEETIGTVIGSGGKTIKRIMALTSVDISIEDDGRTMVSGTDPVGLEKAAEIIGHLVNGFDRDEVVEGMVTRVEDYGIFVELAPGINGLIHRSRMKDKRPVKDKFKVGDKVMAKYEGMNDRKQIMVSEA